MNTRNLLFLYIDFRLCYEYCRISKMLKIFQILVDYKNKDESHIEWAKAMKELYLPGLKDYVKSFYPLGPVWNPNGNPLSSPSSNATGSGPAAPPPPSSPLTAPSSSKPNEGMSAIFQEINSGKPVTAGSYAVSATFFVISSH